MKNFALMMSFAVPILTAAQEKASLEYYLPQEVTYDETIPKPSEVIGHEVGEWHVTHDKLVYYMQALAHSSNRIQIEDRGTTYEDRPLLLLTISSPGNLNNLEAIRSAHLDATERTSGDTNDGNNPIVIYQGFSVHGNEPSGSNAALAYAYYLAAAQGPEIDNYLENVVILLDPSFNPDGLQRFAYWANSNRSMNLNPDKYDREYDEVWPGGRTNHYWFDVNRDWLPVQLPESRARIETFHKWLPNILTDHHEMGTNSTFFFQPGEPTRVHPLTPAENQELTAEIGTYHARALDKIGSLYYTEEDYDDYYYGKGSTLPDVLGSVGILFEQASSRGHIQESDNGILTFPFTIRNQFTTALSTLQAAYGMREKLLNYQRRFYGELRNEASSSRIKGYIFGDRKDATKAWHLADVLRRHKIRILGVREELNIGNYKYEPGSSYIVPTDQKNARLISAMFEKRTSFTDSLFYDISAWTLPLAFNLDYSELNSLSAAVDEQGAPSMPPGKVSHQSQYAYLFEWHNYYSPKAMDMILGKGVRVKVGKEKFSLGGRNYDYGTILIPVANQVMGPSELYNFLQTVASDSHVDIFAADTGITKGIDLGSRNFETVQEQKVALLVGEKIRPYDAGEIWHLFDTRYQTKITKLDTKYLNSVELDKYTDIIIPGFSGSQSLDEKIAEKLENWVKRGGTLIGYGKVAEWLDKHELIELNFRKDTLVAKNITYAQKQAFEGAQETGGAIFEAQLDRSHPINYGYKNDRLPVFRNSNIYLEPDKDSYNNPIRYTPNPLLSGYISEENLDLLKNSVPFQAKESGKGRIIVFTDDTNFRAFWYGTNKLLMNAIYFGPLM
jgi:hypothetical protein